MNTGKKLFVLLMSMLVTGSVAAAEGNFNEVGKKVLLRGEICEFEAGDIYKMKTAEGEVVRVHLGKWSGRFLNRTPFDVKGTMVQDEKGLFLKMSEVDYKDVDPFAEYFAALERMKHPEKGGLGLEMLRDKAFDHELPVSDDSIVYKNNIKKLTLAQMQEYANLDVSQIKAKESGTKIILKGRAIQTVVDREVMEFWDAAGGSINVKMNGAYCPLGQRCFIYGTVAENDNKQVYIDLDYMESVDLPAEAYQ